MHLISGRVYRITATLLASSISSTQAGAGCAIPYYSAKHFPPPKLAGACHHVLLEMNTRGALIRRTNQEHMQACIHSNCIAFR